jgi:hypothetical protein
MSTKVYAATFTYENSSPAEEFTIVNPTAGEWTEQVGGYHFAKAIAHSKTVSFSKAQKSLLRTQGDGFEDLVEKELSIFEETIHTVMSIAEQRAPIDELQVIGGASALNFVVETIKRATNLTIRRDFNANEAVALGALLAGLAVEDASPYVKSIINLLPTSTVNITCGNRSLPQQIKGGSSQSYVTFSDLPEVCTEFAVVADPQTIPEGVDPVISRYVAKENVTVAGTGNFTVTFQFERLHSQVRGVQWCQSGECQDSEAVLQPIWVNELNSAFDFVREYLGAVGNREIRSQIKELLGRINAQFARLNRANVEATFQPTEEMKEWVAEINAANETDGFASLNTTALEEVQARLNQVAKVTRLDK